MAIGEDNVIQGLFAADDWARSMIRSEKGHPIECWQNVFVVLTEHPAWKGRIFFDTFSQVATKRSVNGKGVPTGKPDGPWMAEDDNDLGLWLAQQVHLTIKSVNTVSQGVLAAAQAIKVHPVRDWLESRVWDGQKRLETWLHEWLGAEAGPYSAAVGRYWPINMVRRIYEPGCVMRTVPVLEGVQDRGKSTALRLLADPWFSEAPLDLSSKDCYELIQGVWLQEIPEMHSFNRAEANKVKQFISQRQDSWVPKYIRGRVMVQRQTCIAGTTNDSLYLKDWTGGTRFHPFRCGELRLDLIADLREQLFAEAVQAYKAGARSFPTPEETEQLFEPAQAERLIEHPWVSVVAAYLRSNTFARTTMGEVLKEACKVPTDKMTVAHTQDVGRIMSALGWTRKREPSGERGWFYERPKPANEAAPEAMKGSGDGEDGDDRPF